MLVDGAGADGAAAGHRDAGAAVAGQQRPEHQHRGAHRLHQLVGGLGGDCRRPTVDRDQVLRVLPSSRARLAAHGAQHLEHGVARPPGRARCGRCVAPSAEQRGGEDGQRRVLRARGVGLALQGAVAGDDDRVHVSSGAPRSAGPVGARGRRRGDRAAPGPSRRARRGNPPASAAPSPRRPCVLANLQCKQAARLQPLRRRVGDAAEHGEAVCAAVEGERAAPSAPRAAASPARRVFT